MFGLSRVQIGITIALIVGLVLLGATVISQAKRAGRLEDRIAAEEAARKRDVGALTVLSQGLLAASKARGVDEEVLRETIDHSNPQPVSPGLGRFLDGLRSAEASPPAARANPADPARAAPSSR